MSNKKGSSSQRSAAKLALLAARQHDTITVSLLLSPVLIPYCQGGRVAKGSCVRILQYSQSGSAATHSYTANPDKTRQWFASIWGCRFAGGIWAGIPFICSHLFGNKIQIIPLITIKMLKHHCFGIHPQYSGNGHFMRAGQAIATLRAEIGNPGKIGFTSFGIYPKILLTEGISKRGY